MGKLTIYVAAHKEYTVQRIPGYTPIQVGAALHEKLPYLSDSTGDNISEKNPYYSELTGMYWAWKNDHESDIVGIAHYRRYFIDEDNVILDEKKIRNILSKYDVITSELNGLEEGHSIREQYEQLHEPADVAVARDVIQELYPEYLKDYDEVMNGTSTYICNMIIAKKKLFDRYCEWMFSILFEMEKYIDPEKYNNYNKRCFGLISERLETVWIRHNRLAVCEMRLGCTEEKFETRETREQGEKLIEERRLDEILPLMQDAYDKRPDMFLWTSDITGRLSDLLMIGRIIEAEKATGTGSGCFKTLTKAKDVYAVLDRIKGYMNSKTNVDEICSFIVENDLSPAMVKTTFLSDRSGADLMTFVAQLAEGFARIGDMNRTAFYAQMAIMAAEG
ncbi:MAG: DUF4422 domain-containing protein [Lachnospiraceae bacterium]|nr:DUF4422 domain-containing protein [Lachnospiraceae bacterium]